MCTIEKASRIVDAYMHGVPTKKIVEVERISWATLYNVLKKNNVASNRYAKRADVDHDAVRKMLDANLSYKQIAKALDVNIHHVQYVARRLNMNQKCGARHKEEMLELRAMGFSNAQIANRLGLCGRTIRENIGNQPKEMSLNNRRAGLKRRKIAVEARKENHMMMRKKAEDTLYRYKIAINKATECLTEVDRLKEVLADAQAKVSAAEHEYKIAKLAADAIEKDALEASKLLGKKTA